MKKIILLLLVFLFVGCSTKEKEVKPKWNGAYPTGHKYKDVYHSNGYDFGYTL